MARSVPEDAYCGLAEPGQLARDIPEIEVYDPEEPATEVLIERAKLCEEAARAVSGVTNSEGAEAGWSSSRIALAASNGFSGGYAVSRHSMGVSVLAGEGLNMERDYEFASRTHGADLEDPAEIGRRAGARAVKRLGARKAATGRFPVVYDPRVSNGLLGHLAGAISGPAVARGTSFLKDKMGEAIFAQGITIVDDPHRPRGLRSKPVDGEGVANGRRKVIDISGDGRTNQGSNPARARDDAVAQGITINGLAILNEDGLVDRHYLANVIGGTGSFVLQADDYSDFARAIVEKLIKEIAGVPIAALPPGRSPGGAPGDPRSNPGAQQAAQMD